jgi:ABC-type Fe3+ transport system substrate-binding protein
LGSYTRAEDSRMTRLLSFMSEIAQQGAEAPLRPARELDLLLYAPCPVKLVLKDAVDAAGPFASHVPMGCTSVDPYDPLRDATDPDELPAVIASIGFGDFWRSGFASRFVDTGVFETVRPEVVSPLHAAAGMTDPRGAYTIYGVTPYLFMVDDERLGSTPAPRTWAELLEPRYRGRITMCGDGDDMADAALLAMYQEAGMEGVETLARQCRGLMHSSSMTKAAGNRRDADAAVFIMPAFFACSTRQPAGVRVIWPEDGAAASPLYFLAKKTEQERVAPLLRALTEGFAAIPSAAWFVPLALPPERSPLPPEARLKWPGWDFIQNCDVNALRDELGQRFRATRKAMWDAGREAGACAS